MKERRRDEACRRLSRGRDAYRRDRFRRLGRLWSARSGGSDCWAASAVASQRKTRRVHRRRRLRARGLFQHTHGRGTRHLRERRAHERRLRADESQHRKEEPGQAAAARAPIAQDADHGFRERVIAVNLCDRRVSASRAEYISVLGGVHRGHAG